MRIVSKEELVEILEKHKKWINSEEGGECADLSGANLSGANLRCADLSGANLSGADLSGADLDQKERIRFGMILKEDLIAYKKCEDKLIVELCIPKGSIVFSINNSKCRTNRAKVISISNIENDKQYDKATSTHDSNFVYEVGKELEIEDFDLMYNVECGSGIHFFRTRKEAEEY